MPGLLYLLFLIGGLEPQAVPTPPPTKRAVPYDAASQWRWTKETWIKEGDGRCEPRVNGWKRATPQWR